MPPTRVTLLFSDVDDPTANGIGRGNDYGFPRSQTRTDSLSASQNESHRVKIISRNLASHTSYLLSCLTHTIEETVTPQAVLPQCR